MQQEMGIAKGRSGTELFAQCCTLLQAMWHVGKAVSLTFANACLIVWFLA
jgi:hypothetical protein